MVLALAHVNMFDLILSLGEMLGEGCRLRSIL